jgi:hypothetical protein
MPLSRHLYSSDDIQAALSYSISQNSVKESLFWAKELVESGYASEAISVLFHTWLFNCGHTCIRWLIDAWATFQSDEITEQDILLSTYNLSKYSITDSSLWNIVTLATQFTNSPPDRITKRKPHSWDSDNAIETFFICSIYQGKSLSAWWASRYIPEERVWELLEWFTENAYTNYKKEYMISIDALKNYDTLLGYKTDEYDVIIRCQAILLFCIKPVQQSTSFRNLSLTIDKDNLESIQEWDKNSGTKKRRVFKIPTACLYGTTKRGLMKWSSNNFSEINNIEENILGCPFWDDVLLTFATICDGRIEWNSEESLQEFYETYFPDDIPDEWSKSDKSVSHGDGILGPTDKITIWKYSRNYLSKKSRLNWNQTKASNKILEQIDIPDCNISKIIGLYIEPSEIIYDKLKPVTKRLICS